MVIWAKTLTLWSGCVIWAWEKIIHLSIFSVFLSRMHHQKSKKGINRWLLIQHWIVLWEGNLRFHSLGIKYCNKIYPLFSVFRIILDFTLLKSWARCSAMCCQNFLKYRTHELMTHWDNSRALKVHTEIDRRTIIRYKEYTWQFEQFISFAPILETGWSLEFQ